MWELWDNGFQPKVKNKGRMRRSRTTNTLIIVSDSFIMISELEMFFIIPVWAKEDEKNIQIKHFWLAFILWFENELSKNNSNRIRFIPTNFDKTES